MSGAVHPSDFDELFNHKRQNAALDRALDKLIPREPRFGITRYYDADAGLFMLDAVWDKHTNRFTPVSEIVTALFAAVGLEAA